uniref:Uncharacterized protein n=1 Tax=Rhizophora mucronata TaxID=61149 RepID=A0A2P2P3N9_RHIMU
MMHMELENLKIAFEMMGYLEICFLVSSFMVLFEFF